MSIQKNLLLLVMLLPALVAPEAAAQTTLVGDPEVGGNCIPFGTCNGAWHIARYQQIYSAELFSGPMDITALTFFMTGGGNINTARYTLRLGMTDVAVGALSTEYDDNLGVGTQVFHDALRGGAVGESFTFAGSGFIYDPSRGNLLLDVQLSNWTADGDARVASGNFVGTSRNVGIVSDDHGLTTQFTYSAVSSQVVPEPATILLVLTGLLAVGVGAGHRSRREERV